MRLEKKIILYSAAILFLGCAFLIVFSSQTGGDRTLSTGKSSDSVGANEKRMTEGGAGVMRSGRPRRKKTLPSFSITEFLERMEDGDVDTQELYKTLREVDLGLTDDIYSKILDENIKMMGLRILAERYSNEDPAISLEWLADLPQNESSSWAYAIIGRSLAGEESTILEASQKITNLGLRGQLLQGFFGELSNTNTEKALQLYLDNRETLEIYNVEILTEITERAAHKDDISSALKVLCHEGVIDALESGSLESTLKLLAIKDSEHVGAWLIANSDIDFLSKSASSLTSIWSRTDYPAAQKWIKTIPAGEIALKDRALHGVSEGYLSIDTVVSAANAVQISDRELRSNALKQVLSSASSDNLKILEMIKASSLEAGEIDSYVQMVSSQSDGRK